MWLVLCSPVQVAVTGRRTQAAVSAARWRTKVWPSAPCDSPGCEGSSTLSPGGETCLAELCKGFSAVDSSLIQLRQKGRQYSRAKRTGARQTEGSPPQGADERVLLSKFTISSCALMLWDKAVTLQYKTTWKHSTTALSFPYWNSAAANNTGTGTTWLLF